MLQVPDPSSYKEAFLKSLAPRKPWTRSVFFNPENFIPLENFSPNAFKESQILNFIKRVNKEFDFTPKLSALDYLMILGAGGVASWFLPQMLKTLFNYKTKLNHNYDTIVYIVDADTVSPSNLLRQNFIHEDLGKNKAVVLAERYDEIYPNIKVRAIPKYFFSIGFLNNFTNLRDEYVKAEHTVALEDLPACDYVFNTLDNEFSKHMLDYFLSERHFGINVTYLSAGCYEHGGTITRFKNLTEFYSSYYKDETFKEDGGTIEDLSCAEIAENLTVEQTFDSNTVAATLLNVVFNNSIVDPYYYLQRLMFVSTANPYTQVQDKQVGLLYSHYKSSVSELAQQVYLYLRQRPEGFKQSPKSKLLKSLMIEVKDDFNWKAIFPNTDLSFLDL